MLSRALLRRGTRQICSSTTKQARAVADLEGRIKTALATDSALQYNYDKAEEKRAFWLIRRHYFWSQENANFCLSL